MKSQTIRGLAVAAVLLSCTGSFAVQPTERVPLPDFDRRTGHWSTNRAEPSSRQTAVEKLKTRLPQAQVTFDPLSGAPKFISAGDQFLTGTNGQGKAVSAAGAAKFSATEPDRPTKAFLHEHRELFGHGPEVLTQARVKREITGRHNGLRTVVWEQQVDGIPLFETLFISHTTRKGELVSISSQFLPDPVAAANRGVTNRAVAASKPDVSARHAVALAARNIGLDIDEASIAPVESAHDALLSNPEQRQLFKSAGFKGKAEAKLIWLPMSQDGLRLCWDVILMSRARGEMFRVLVDSQTGELLVRRCLTDYISDATYRVYTSDSPSPFSPSYSTPVTSQPPLTNRVLITLPALNTNASPNGWIDDGVNETMGNNVDAHTDLNADNSVDLPRPHGSPSRVFDFPLDLTQAPINYTDASVVQLFYWNNFMHDKLYQLGFTEAAGNFQGNNFSRGGLGNDAVQADAQDGSGVNNANFSTPPDGSPGRMQMYIFNGPTPDRDGDLDAEIILHEYTHGLSNRRVGGGVGLSSLQSQGMGEGWSDFYAMALLSEPGDDVNAVYAYGGYATYQLSGLTQNYYFGIRRYPYCTDMSKNPLTFKDIDPSQASTHTGIPRSPIIGTTANEVHNMGEVWCMTLREARASLITKNGWAVGNQLILQLVTDGMNLSPANPNFLQARDAILQADQVDNGGANLTELWTAFAKRGMGKSATSPSSSTTTGLIEAFDVPLLPLQIVIPSSATEGDGLLAGAGQVIMSAATNSNVVVQLASSDTSEVTIPASVTIIAGQTNATFDLTIIDDAVLDGTQTATISASAAGFANAYGAISVSDNETATLQVTLPDTATEGQGTVQGTVQVSAVPEGNITVDLFSSDTTEIQVPASVIIPAGQTSAVFTAALVDDNQIDGAQTATVTAHVQNWTDGSAAITVLDNESMNLVVSLPDSAWENSAVLTNGGSVSISGTWANDLTVSLESEIPEKLTVPPTVTILAGQTSATFNITLVDNSDTDGQQTMTVTASSPGFTNGLASMLVMDDESPVIPSNPRPGNFATNVRANTNLMWNASTGTNELILNGGFESGSLTNWIMVANASGVFVLNNGTVDPPSPDGPLSPFAGSYSALGYESGPSIFYMYQTISIPPDASSVKLNWAHRVRNFYSAFSTSQQFQVRICDTNNNILATPFSTNPGDPLLGNWVQTNYDMIAFAGQTVRVEFWVNSQMYFIDAHVDNVSVQTGMPITASPAGVVTNDIYFGTNPTPGPAEFQGSTTNSSWTVPQLAPQTTYYWQVVARKVGTATSPVWQFTTAGVDHFVWNPIQSPQLVSQPFSATITAQDAFNTTVSNFTGTAVLSAIAGGLPDAFHADFEGGLQGFSINNSFGSGNGLWHVSTGRGANAGHSPTASLYYGHNESSSGGGNYDTGTANGGVATSSGIALPSGTNLLTLSFNYLMSVESGTTWDQTIVEVSTNNGNSYTVVASKSSGLSYNTGGLWVSNSVPLTQFAGSTILLRFRFDTIDSIGNSTEGWYLDDIVIRSGSGSTPIGLSPTNSGNFVDGAWTGNINVLQPATNVVLRADDAGSHTGISNPFDVALMNDVSISITASPSPVSAGANLTYTLAVANTGPSAATEVMVTNLLPASAAFVSATASQGTCTQSDGIVTSGLGVMPGGSNATITILVAPMVAGTTLTNSATVSRAEADPFLGNNAALVTTAVTAPAISIADASVVEGNVGTTNMVFNVTLAVPSAQTITVNFATTDGGATAGSDYLSTNGMLTFLPGTTNGTITVAVMEDTIIETNETFFVTLSNPVNCGLGRSPGVGTIVNDDGVPGQVDHFIWNPISSPQPLGQPFSVTVTALDYFNNVATNFNGTANLDASAGGGAKTNMILGNLAYSNSGNYGTFTLGYSFTPTTNLTVTHVRSYSGTKVSIWTDAGVLLASQNVSSIPGTWVETPLSTPLTLNAGSSYRVALYSAGTTYYWRNDGSNSFADGTINQSYEISGDAFPTSTDSVRWWFVDFRYTVGSAITVPISPPVSSVFNSGVWSGAITVSSRATNAVLAASDGNGHIGTSNPFDVVPFNMPPVMVTQPASQTDLVHSSAIFTATADGSPTLTYQWSFNGTNLPGATNASLVLSNLQYTQAGPYFVTVTNAYGSVASSNAMLTVTSHPPVAAPDSVAFFVGTPQVSFTVLFNDSDVDGDLLTVQSFTTPTRGTLVQIDNGQFRYQPNPDFTNGLDQFNYTITDGHGGTATAPVTIRANSQSLMGGDWPTFGNGPSHTGYYPAMLGGATLTPAWSTNFGSALNQVAVGDGHVYVTPITYFGATYLTAVDAVSGQPTWQITFNNAFSINPPTYDHGRVYVQRCDHASDTQLWCINAADGSVAWNAPHQAQWERYYAPLVYGDGIWVDGGSYGGMYGFNTNGTQRFFYNGLAQYDQWTPTYYQGAVYSWVAGYFRAHDPQTGAVLWMTTSGWNWDGWSMNTVSAIDGGRAFVQQRPNLIAIDLTTHTNAWTASGGVKGSPAVANGIVYAIIGDGVQAYAAQNGTSLGVYRATNDTGLAWQPIVTDDALFISSSSATYVFDLASHQLLQTIPYGGPLSMANGLLYIAGQDGWLRTYTVPNTPPVITSQPASQLVYVGQSATFSVSARGAAPIQYLWRRDGTVIDGAASPTYTANNVQLSDSGSQFSCIVSNSLGTTLSSNATLTVNPGVAPVITVQPASLKVLAGAAATFSVTATGTGPLQYLWQRNGTFIIGATNSSYTANNVQVSDSGAQFSCLVSNAYGTALSSSATLTVGVVPAITVHPTSQSVAVGATATFGVTATGTAPLQFFWRRNGTFINGATNSIYTAINVQLFDSGAQFSCVVSNAFGTALSSIATLTVVAAPAITVQPTNLTVYVGATASFIVTASGTAPLSFFWSHSSTNLPGATNNSLNIPNIQFSDAGTYAVIVSNLAGSVTSSVAVLTVIALPPQAVIAWGLNDSGQANVPPSAFSVRAIAAGYGHSLALKTDGTLIAWGANDNIQTNLPPGLGNVTAVAAGYYHNLAINPGGTVAAWGYDAYGQTEVPADLSNVVAVAGTEGFSLALKSDGTVAAWGYNGEGETDVPAGLSNVVAVAGGDWHSLALTAEGSVVSWGWNDGGQTDVPAGLSDVVAVGGGVSHSLALKANGTVVAWGDNSYGQTSVPAGLTNVVAIAGGGYFNLALKTDGTVVGWGDNSAGQTTIPDSASNVVAIAAGYMHSLAALGKGSPTFTIQPWNRSVVAGSEVRLTAMAVGAAPLHYQWQLNGTNLDNATNATCIRPNAQAPDAGSYTLVVTNLSGSVTSAVAVLSVLGPPYFTLSPMSQTVTNGSNATLTVTAIGTAPLRYLWQFNGTNLTNDARITGSQTNVLNIATVRAGDAGNYRIVVTNGYGSSTSSVAALAVAKATPVINWTNPADIGYGTVLTSLQLNANSSVPGLFVYIPSAGAVLSAGTNPLSVAFTPTDAASYNTATSHVSIVVTKAPLTVTAANATRAYGQANPVFTGTLTGVTNGDPIDVTYDCNATMASPPGDYAIVPSLDDPNSRLGNYAVTANNGALTVTCPSITLSPADLPGGTIGVGYSQNLSAVGGAGSCSFSVTAGTLPSGLILAANGVLGGTPSASGTNIFTVTATDTNGCTGIQDYTVTTIGVAPIITGQPQSATNLVGTSANFNVSATGTAPLSYQWQFKGTNLDDNARLTGSQSNELGIASVNVVDAGDYQVIITNNYGAATSSVAQLVVVGIAGVPPNITSQPQSSTNPAGTTVTFFVASAGDQPLSYQWRLNETNLTDGGNVSGSTNATLTLNNVLGGDAGGYSVVITNVYGAATSTVVSLTVIDDPSIATQPAGRTNAVGTTATFSVTASGSPPFAYQWFNGSLPLTDGGNVSGSTTDLLSLGNVQLTDVADYCVVVTNSWGSVTSQVAQLTVTLPPLVIVTTDAAFGFKNYQFQFTLTGPAGSNAIISASPDLQTWTPLLTNPLVGGSFMFTDVLATNFLQRFYRATLAP